VNLRHSQVEFVARRELPVSEDDLLGFLNYVSIDREDFIHKFQQCIENRLDHRSTVEVDLRKISWKTSASVTSFCRSSNAFSSRR